MKYMGMVKWVKQKCKIVKNYITIIIAFVKLMVTVELCMIFLIYHREPIEARQLEGAYNTPQFLLCAYFCNYITVLGVNKN